MGYRKPQYRFASIYNPANAQLDPGVRNPVQLPSIPPVGRRQATAKQLNRSLKMDSENEYPPEDRYPDSPSYEDYEYPDALYPDYPDSPSYEDYRQGNLYTSDENDTSDTGPSDTASSSSSSVDSGKYKYKYKYK